MAALINRVMQVLKVMQVDILICMKQLYTLTHCMVYARKEIREDPLPNKQHLASWRRFKVVDIPFMFIHS